MITAHSSASRISGTILLVSFVLVSLPVYSQIPKKKKSIDAAIKKKLSGRKDDRGKKIALPERGDLAGERSNHAEKKAATDRTDKKSANGKTVPNKKQKQAQTPFEKDKKLADWIVKTLDYGIQSDRRDALNSILKISDKKIRAELAGKVVGIIRDEVNTEIKIKAIVIAGELQAAEAVPDLVKLLENDTEEVKTNAVYAIKRIKDGSTAPVLAQKLKGQDLTKNSNYTIALLSTLTDFKTAELESYAVTGLKNKKTTPNNKEQLMLMLGRIATTKETRDYIVKLLRDEDEEQHIRSLAASAIARLGMKENAKDIEEIAKKIESMPLKKKRDYNNLYMYCITAMVRLGDREAYPRLMNSLRSDVAKIRLRAIKLIKELKDKRTIDILKYKMQHDPDPQVQKAARDALKKIEGDETALPKDKAKSDATDKKNGGPGGKNKAH